MSEHPAAKLGFWARRRYRQETMILGALYRHGEQSMAEIQVSLGYVLPGVWFWSIALGMERRGLIASRWEGIAKRGVHRRRLYSLPERPNG